MKVIRILIVGVGAVLILFVIAFSLMTDSSNTKDGQGSASQLSISNKSTPVYSNDSSKHTKPKRKSMWRVGHYVDEFGDFIADTYMTTNDRVRGTFSNSATQNSDLNVSIIITPSSNPKGPKVSIQLFEYAGNNPVKAYDQDKYIVFVKFGDGSKRRFEAINSSDRLRLNYGNGCALHEAFLKYNDLKFHIQEQYNSTTEYNFVVDATGYTSTYNKL